MTEPMSDDLLEALRAQCDKPGRVFFFRNHARALVDEVDRLTAEVAHRRQQNRELAAMEESARKQHRALSDRISDMANCWERELPEAVRTAWVVSCLRSAVEAFP